MAIALVILAATMGNRYGGLKYLEPIGPHGETILDYSVFDAIKVGFTRIIFVINPSFEKEFKAQVSAKYDKLVKIEYVYQDISDVPESKRNTKRLLLWGSAHAVLKTRDLIDMPFGVINAVNFYQRESFELLYQHLFDLTSSEYSAFMIGYKLRAVMPESGSANRGLCKVDIDNDLLGVTELAGVELIGGHPMYKNSENTWISLNEESWVSMNMWGFSPSLFKLLENGFEHFISLYGKDVKRAYILPDFINEIILSGNVKVKNIPTESRWMALVSPDDKIQTLLRINELIRKGIYPSRLF